MAKLQEAIDNCVCSKYDTRLDQCKKIILFELKKNIEPVSTAVFKYILFDYGFATATYQRALTSLAEDKKVFTRRGRYQYVWLLPEAEADNGTT